MLEINIANSGTQMTQATNANLIFLASMMWTCVFFFILSYQIGFDCD